ncbi:MAG TPA: alpha/beta hydrolase [Gaiellaceae bacterium]|nr:alpha/beta hydrolase [Gaiellaceae bacterium]
MKEEAFEVAIAGGVLCGHRSDGDGPPALLLHGGAAVPDYLEALAAELAPFFTTYRYTQRGTLPSGGDPPYGIEAHVEDAVAVLDAFEIPQAWAVGHSWGGHLALHLALAHPDRLLGLVLVDPLGAYVEVFADLDASLRDGLAPATVARLDDIEARRREGDVTEEELVERFAIVWPRYFADPESPVAASPATHSGVAASIGVNRSLGEHFQRRTLIDGLPDVRLPVLFVHGELDPIPPESSLRTAALIPGARVEVIPACGHFPWLETPGEVAKAVASMLG